MGTVYQFVGVMLFLGMMFICCSSSLFSKATTEHADWSKMGWHLPSDPADQPTFSAARMLAIAVPVGVLLGVAWASLGLGFQATRRHTPLVAVVVGTLATLFWIIQTIFAVHILHGILVSLLGLLLVVISGLMLAGAWASYKEMKADPPPPEHENLPADYKAPYSHLHQDPPEVRLERELAERRRKLELQQKELEMLERDLQRRKEEKS